MLVNSDPGGHILGEAVRWALARHHDKAVTGACPAGPTAADEHIRVQAIPKHPSGRTDPGGTPRDMHFV